MKKALPLIVALVLGALAVVGTQNYLKNKDAEFKKKHSPKKVIVASQKIKAGEKLNMKFLQERSFPKAMLPENAITSQDLKDVVNRPVNRDIYPGEPISYSVIGGTSSKKILSQEIPLDERAITITVDNESGINGYLQPNDKVDIYITTTVPKKEEQSVPGPNGNVTVEVEKEESASFLLLQNVAILATGSSYAQGSVPTQQAYANITLSVTPAEAGLLKFSSEVGRLTLSLRNPKDFGEAQEIEIYTKKSVLDVTRLRDLQNQRKKRIEVYRQGKISSVQR